MYRKLSCGSVKNLLKPLGDSTATDEPEGFFIMKKCNKCGEVKPLEDFYKDKRYKYITKHYCKCKKCCVDYSENHRRSVKGKALEIFSGQGKSSKQRGYNPPTYSRDEFIDWMLNNQDYIRLHDEWVKSGYNKNLTPSVDRLDDYKRYSFDNIRVVTWEENLRKVSLDKLNGVNNKQSKAVVKMNLNGLELEKYYSINQASRENGVHYQSISKVCNGKRKTAGGFKWRYVDA